jgi:hypothetical protein
LGLLSHRTFHFISPHVFKLSLLIIGHKKAITLIFLQSMP